MCFCLIQKKWKLQNINLACFKLSLLVFYQFIDVPYGYLFYTCIVCEYGDCGSIVNSPEDCEDWKSESVMKVPSASSFRFSYLLQHLKQFINIFPVVGQDGELYAVRPVFLFCAASW